MGGIIVYLKGTQVLDQKCRKSSQARYKGTVQRLSYDKAYIPLPNALLT